jgi:hypothetical protein
MGKVFFKILLNFLCFSSVEILFFPVIRLFSAATMRETPSLPRGEATHGEHPLDPHIFLNRMRVIAIGDTIAAGAEARCAKSSQERLLVSLKDFYRTCVSNICGTPGVFPDYAGPIG